MVNISLRTQDGGGGKTGRGGGKERERERESQRERERERERERREKKKEGEGRAWKLLQPQQNSFKFQHTVPEMGARTRNSTCEHPVKYLRAQIHYIKYLLVCAKN